VLIGGIPATRVPACACVGPPDHHPAGRSDGDDRRDARGDWAIDRARRMIVIGCFTVLIG
jgi:hypothetical protein